MKIGIAIVHNKANATQNTAQITSLKSLLTNVIGTDGVLYQTFNSLAGGHTFKVFQAIPFGVTAPATRYDINSGGIIYFGAGDDDKTGTHPRFFNWGMARAMSQSCDIYIYCTDPSLMTAIALQASLNKFTNNVEYVEETWGKLVSKKAFTNTGQFNEAMTFTNANTDYKTRLTQKGLNYG